MRYGAEGLRAFAATCEQHAVASGTRDVLATRIRSTAPALSSAAGRYPQAETQSADALGASIDTDSR
jgi:hypothetical protein